MPLSSFFSNNEPNEYIVREPYINVRESLNNKMREFLDKYPNPDVIDNLKSEVDKKNFVLAFRDIN